MAAKRGSSRALCLQQVKGRGGFADTIAKNAKNRGKTEPSRYLVRAMRSVVMGEKENVYTLFAAVRKEKKEGNKEKAQLLYRRVIVEYPDEFEASVSKPELAELEGRKACSNTESKEGENTNDVNQIYPEFNRKQLAWMGLLLGGVLILVLNWEYSYRSIVEDSARVLFSYRNHETGVWTINVVLVMATWFLRVALGIIFAFIVGVAINVFAFILKRV